MRIDSDYDRADFDDQAILDEIDRGIGDDVEDEWGTLLCAPHSSALRHYTVAWEKIEKSNDQGWASYDVLPCWPLRASPIGIVDETKPQGDPKFRLTNDLSWPPPSALPDGGGTFVASHNDAMDRSGWPEARLLRVSQFAEAVAILRASNAPVKLWSVDCEAYYRMLGRRPAQLWRNAIAIEGGFQLDERCCFGSAADATKCSRVSNFLVHAVKKALRDVDARYPSRDPRVLEWARARRDRAVRDELHALGMYVDDAMAASFDDLLFDTAGKPLMRNGTQLRRAQLHFETMKSTLLRFGHKSSEKKEQPPCDRIEILGVEIDIRLGRLSLQSSKAKKYLEYVEKALAEEWIEKKTLERLLGRLQFAAMCHPVSRQWLHSLYKGLRARYRRWDGNVRINAAARNELKKWRSALSRSARGVEVMAVPLASPPDLPPMGSPRVGAIYADASGEIGFGAWILHGDEVLYIIDEWSSSERDELIIADKELLASTIALEVLAPAADLAAVYSFTDNTVAMGAMRKLTPSTTSAQFLIIRQVDWLLANGVSTTAERVSSAHNLWADLLSRRGGEQYFLRQAAALGLRPRKLEIPASARCTARLLEEARAHVAREA